MTVERKKTNTNAMASTKPKAIIDPKATTDPKASTELKLLGAATDLLPSDVDTDPDFFDSSDASSAAGVGRQQQPWTNRPLLRLRKTNLCLCRHTHATTTVTQSSISVAAAVTPRTMTRDGSSRSLLGDDDDVTPTDNKPLKSEKTKKHQKMIPGNGS